jgi:hypothetical protein
MEAYTSQMVNGVKFVQIVLTAAKDAEILRQITTSFTAQYLRNSEGDGD